MGWVSLRPDYRTPLGGCSNAPSRNVGRDPSREATEMPNCVHNHLQAIPGGGSGFAHLQLGLNLLVGVSVHHHLTKMVEDQEAKLLHEGQPRRASTSSLQFYHYPSSHTPLTLLTTNCHTFQKRHSTFPRQASTYKRLKQSYIYTPQRYP